MRYDYLIVGTGLFGAVFAAQMNKAGKKCLCIDKRSHIGGNIYTAEEHGIQVHQYGAHIFHTSNREIWEFVNQYADFNQYINSPIAVYGEELYNLPFNMNTFSKLWGIKTPAQAKAIIEKQRQEALEEICGAADTAPEAFKAANLEEQALSLVGRDVYEKLVKVIRRSSGAEAARNFRHLLSADCRFVLFMTIIILQTDIRVFPLVDTQG